MTESALWEAAWAERARLLAIARRRCRSRAEAEEIVSEATLRCVTHPGVQPDRLAAMLTAVTMRLCVDELRSRSLLDRHGPRTITRPDDAMADVLDRAEAQWLSAEMARLADSERAALTARMLGLTVEETAEALGMSYKAAESALGRARRKMRTVWARTLGIVLPWRWRRRGGAPLASVAVASTLLMVPALRHATEPEVRLPRATSAGQGTSLARTVPPRPAPPSPPVRTAQPVPVASPSARPTVTPGASQAVRVVTERIEVGPVAQEPVVVTVQASSPLGHAVRCAERGVEVRTGEARVGVVCREG